MSKYITTKARQINFSLNDGKGKMTDYSLSEGGNSIELPDNDFVKGLEEKGLIEKVADKSEAKKETKS